MKTFSFMSATLINPACLCTKIRLTLIDMLSLPKTLPGKPNEGSYPKLCLQIRHVVSLMMPPTIIDRSGRLLLCAWLCLLLTTTAMAEDGVPFDRTPYHPPYSEYAAWLEFMDKAPDTAWQAASVSRWVNRSSFQNCVQGSTLKVETFKYLSDDLSIKAFMVAPTSKNQSYPIILFAHGGVAEWGRITFFDVLEMCRLAERGYIVLASTLRGEGGSEGRANLGSGEVTDMLNLMRVAHHVDGADPERIGVWGFSRGGGLTYRLLATTDAIRAAVVVGAPSDHLDTYRREEFHEHVYPKVIPGYTDNPERSLRSISAIYWPQRLHFQTPLLMLHGRDDDRVKVDQTLRMAIALDQAGHPNIALQVFPKGSHTLIEQRDRMRAAMDEWFDENLR